MCTSQINDHTGLKHTEPCLLMNFEHD